MTTTLIIVLESLVQQISLDRSNFTAKQVMSVTGHKSIQRLSIYQKVRKDDKLFMGISLTYSLLHPNEVRKVLDIIDQEKKALENTCAPTPGQLALPPPENPIPTICNPTQAIAPVTPVISNTNPLENTVVLYNQTEHNQQAEASEPMDAGNLANFDLLSMLSDLDNDDEME